MLVLPVGLVLGLLAGQPALAGPDGWTLTGTATITGDLLYNENGNTGSGQRLEPQLQSNFDLLLERRSRTSVLALQAGISPGFVKGSSGNALNRLAPSLGGSLTVQGRRMAFNAGFNASIRDTAFTDATFTQTVTDTTGTQTVIDTSVFSLSTGTALETSLSANTGFSYQVNDLNTLSIGATYSSIDFSDGAITLAPSTTIGINLDWSTRLTPRLDAGLSLGVSWFQSDSQSFDPLTTVLTTTDTSSVSVDLANNATFRATRRLTLNGSLGVSLVNTEDSSTVTAGGITTTTSADETTTNFSGSFGFDYTGDDLTIGGVLSQSVQPSSLGSLQNTTALNLRLNYSINRRLSFGVDSRFQLQRSVGNGTSTAITSFQIAPGFSYQLDANTSLGLGYRYDLTSSTGSRLQNHNVFVSLTRNFNFLP